MSKRREITAEEKISLVVRYLQGELGIRDTGRQAGVDEATIRQWVSLYRAEGSNGLLPQEQNRQYTKELKLRAM